METPAFPLLGQNYIFIVLRFRYSFGNMFLLLCSLFYCDYIVLFYPPENVLFTNSSYYFMMHNMTSSSTAHDRCQHFIHTYLYFVYCVQTQMNYESNHTMTDS